MTDDEAQSAVGALAEAQRAVARQSFDEALTLARSAAETFIEIDGPHSPDGANALLTVADALLQRSTGTDLAESAIAYERAASMLAPLGPDCGSAVDTLRLRAVRGIGTAARARAAFADAAEAFEEALALAETAFGANSEEVGHVCNDLGILGKFTASFEEARDWYQRALSIIESTAGPRSAAAATLHHNLAGLAHSRQRSSEGIASGRLSVEIRRELVGDDDVEVAADRANLGGLLFDVGEVDEAAACFEAARVTYERALGPEHLEVAIACNNLAAVARERGERDEAERLYRQALRMKTRDLGPRHPSTQITAVNLAHVVSDQAEAIRLLEGAVEALTGVVGEDDRTLAAARQGLADRSAR